ncbi:transporter substrate-binding domain-containing protein [bacterium]|nr:transporter substrate-binding domain-containing protein [bacterium]
MDHLPAEVANVRRSEPVMFLLLILLAVVAEPSWAAGREVSFGIVDIEPLAFRDEGEPAGLFVDLLEAVGEEQGWRLRFEAVTWDEGMQQLASGELDLMPTVAYSADRDSVLDFCSEHVVTLWSQVYTRGSGRIETVFELSGERVALMRGDMNAANFQRLVDRFGVICDTLWVDSLEGVFAAVRDGRAAAGVAPNVFGYEHAHEFELMPSPILFAPFAVYYATTAGQNAQVLASLDAALREWRDSPDSVYFQRLDHWLGRATDDGRLPPWILVALAAAVLVAVLLVLANRNLEHRVRMRTRALVTSEQRFRAVFESAGDSILVLRDDRFVECNPRTLELFRCTRDQIIGHRPDEFSPSLQPDGQSSIEAARARIESARGGGRVSFEWQHRRQDGTLFDAEVTLNEFEVGGERFVQAFVRDITRRKQLESDLRQAQKMEAIGTLAGGIAHDFNNILSVIMGYAELVRGDLDGQRDLQEYLGQITRASERARGLVQQILTFSRRSAENKQVIELADVVDEALVLLRSSIPTSIEIHSETTTRGRVFADPTSMHQIIMNLCTNAYQAFDDQAGRIELRLDEEQREGTSGGRFVVLTVADDGPGVPVDVLPKIFEPYFTTKPADRGTGLGLAVVHGIIEDHGGTIEASSAPGEGAVFRVSLPATEREESPTATDIDLSRPASGGERVLLVDDEAELVDVFARGLERLGYRVTAFTSPHEALEALRADPEAHDVLVTDMTMPGLTGAALARAALALAPDLPVLLCTGYSDGLTADSARELGVRDLIMKPVAVNRLAHRIRMTLATAPPP